eukprot:symbB.v1.2.020992.t1/scaffold1759.1/size102758/8
MFWNIFNCYGTTTRTRSSSCDEDEDEEVVFKLPISDCFSSCLNCGGLCEKNEYAGYDPDNDPYDVTTAVIEVSPKEPPERLLRKQILALDIRIQRGGDPQTVQHYEKVLQELKNELPPTAALPRRLRSAKSRKDSSMSELRSMSTGLWDDVVDANFSDFTAEDLFSDSEDEAADVVRL